MNKQLFFCFGLPKSGTTFLQRTLNLHPEISCPSEHQFNFLIDNFSKLLEEYDRVIKITDRFTGGQGATPLRRDLHQQLFRFTVLNMIWGSAKGKRIAGANDNAIISRLDVYDSLFSAPKFIAIFRNPIDVAISAWHYNSQLAINENNPNHKLLMTRHGGFDGWVKYVAKEFSRDAQTCASFREKHENIMIVRYEDLISDKKTNLSLVFNFLGASVDEQILSRIMSESSFSYMKNTSARKDFFRAASNNMGKGVISDGLRKDVSSIAFAGLQALGYDLSI